MYFQLLNYNHFSHIYIVLGERVDDEEWIVRVWYKPFISLIWIGAIITALGGIVGLINRRNYSKKSLKVLGIFLFLLFLPINSHTEPSDISNYDNSLEKRIQSINQNIRCMVCESQTIDDSNSPLAKDLRAIVKEKVLKGETDYQVYSFFRDRYGDYIILKPPFRPNTFILWFAPILIIILGCLIIFISQKKYINKFGDSNGG